MILFACYEDPSIKLPRPVLTTALAAAKPPVQNASKDNLNRRLIRQRCDGLWLVVLRSHSPWPPRQRRLTLEMHLRTFFLRLSPLSCVLLHSTDELFARTGVADVLGADVYSFLDVAVTDLLVEDDANCALGHVVDDACLAVVDFIGLEGISD